MERLLLGLARATTRAPRRTLLLLALATLGAALLLPGFKINPDIASLLPADHPAVELSRELENSSSRTMFLTLRGENIAEYLPEVIETLEDSEHLEAVDATLEALLSSRAKQFGEAPLHFLSESGLADLEARLSGPDRLPAIQDSADLLAEDPLAGSEIVKRDPLGLRWILSGSSELPEGFATDTPYLLLDEERLALLRVTGKSEAYEVEFSTALVSDIEERIAALELPGFEGLGLIGGYAIARSDAARIRSDLSSSLYFSIPLILLFLAISTRSFLRAHIYLAPIALAVLWALGYGSALLGPLTPLAISSAAILIGLGVDFSIHYAGRLEEEASSSEWNAAVERAHIGTGRAILAGGATTIAAFLSFCFGSFPGLFSFGVLLALGLLFSFIATLTLLPLIRVRPRPDRQAVGPVIRIAQSLTTSAAARPIAGLVLAVAALGWGFTLTHGLTFDADPSFLRPAAANQAASDLTDSLGFSPLPVLVLTPATEPIDSLRAKVAELTNADEIKFAEGAHAATTSAEQLAAIEAFRKRTANWVEEALVDFETVGFRKESMRPILEEQAALFEADPVRDDSAYKLKWRGREWWKDALYATGSLSDPARRQTLDRALLAEFGEEREVVNPYGLADELAPVLSSDLVLAMSICSVLVLALVLFWIGNLRAALLALVPVIAGLGVALGVLALFKVPLHPGNFIAIPLILGLGVDDGIHMVMRAREANGKSSGHNPLSITGQAIWRTSATTALGFGSLITAESPALASLGGIALVGVLVCFVTSVLVLPPWLTPRDDHHD